MTTEPKLLTEAEWRERIADWGASEHAHHILADLRERGLIAEEPVDPLLVEAREIVIAHLSSVEKNDGISETEIRCGLWDNGFRVQTALAALRRGMELAPRKELTREMVREVLRVRLDMLVSLDQANAIAADLTEALQ